jgi:hypothetical protein
MIATIIPRRFPMRISRLALLLSVFFLPSLAAAQDRGDVALNMGRGLGSGMSVGWTFKDNWTLQPTIALGYSDQGGFQAALGGTVLRSFGWGHRVYGYVGAGVYYGSANGGYATTAGGPAPRPGTVNGGTAPNNATGSPYYYSNSSLTYLTTPAGLRAKIYGNFELFAEAAYQRTLSGDFGPNQPGQFSGDASQRFGATLGITMRLQ